MITSNTIQQITSRIDIIDVVGEFVKLKKRGTNFIGNCPFHNEKSPSFTVSPSKEIYKCFGCGKSGNTITFLMEHEKYSYVESLRWLAARYNIEIEETETSPAQKIAQQVADSLYAINHFAMDFFAKQYWETESGEAIAQSGRGATWTDKADTVVGGGCYNCHQIDPKEISYGNIGPSLTGYGKLRGNSQEVLTYTWNRINNSKAYNACSNMPRFAHFKLLNEQQIQDVMALLLDPASPVNQ